MEPPLILPDREKNIYPCNKENIEAVLAFLFRGIEIGKGDVSFLLVTGLSLNQIEFIAWKVSENIDFFRRNLIGGFSISNLMNYGVQTLNPDWSGLEGSVNRKQILKDFWEILSNTTVKH